MLLIAVRVSIHTLGVESIKGMSTLGRGGMARLACTREAVIVVSAEQSIFAVSVVCCIHDLHQKQSFVV